MIKSFDTTSEQKMSPFCEEILEGIPDLLPPEPLYDISMNHAPNRQDCLSIEEKKLAIQNALRYFKPEYHEQLAPEFAKELIDHGRIYMYRFRPRYPMYARSIDEYPHRSRQAAAIMLMLQNNLDPTVAQHPHELITYGGNGAVFQNWAQYRLTMQYLATMTDTQTLVLYSGHPLGLFPSHPNAPRVVITNGMVIPNHSKPDDWERLNALGVSQFGQMTAGSFMYIGPQGIVHGTTITLLNAGRKIAPQNQNLEGKLFVSSGLGGMSGAQAKAAVIARGVAIVAEVNPLVISKRHAQGWVDEVHTDLAQLISRAQQAQIARKPLSLAYQGNIVDLWEYLAIENIAVDLGSDQTSLHNLSAGGYYPVTLSFKESQSMMSKNPQQFREEVKISLIRHTEAINQLAKQGMYFFDYGNAFLL
jgi:urocanate hydratase